MLFTSRLDDCSLTFTMVSKLFSWDLAVIGKCCCMPTDSNLKNTTHQTIPSIFKMASSEI